MRCTYCWKLDKAKLSLRLTRNSTRYSLHGSVVVSSRWMGVFSVTSRVLYHRGKCPHHLWAGNRVPQGRSGSGGDGKEMTASVVNRIPVHQPVVDWTVPVPSIDPFKTSSWMHQLRLAAFIITGLSPLKHNTHKKFSSSFSRIWGSHGGEYQDGCFWVAALCRLMWVYHCFRGSYCLHHQGDGWLNTTAQKAAIFIFVSFVLNSVDNSSCSSSFVTRSVLPFCFLFLNSHLPKPPEKLSLVH
jgi:hypothetical protein